MKLNSRLLIGFGISDKASFEKASRYANGAIIGSAFVKAIEGETTIESKVKAFVQKIL
jgi:tryptophan synthase alpha chain